jgi:hypothetical protein
MEIVNESIIITDHEMKHIRSKLVGDRSRNFAVCAVIVGKNADPAIEGRADKKPAVSLGRQIMKDAPNGVQFVGLYNY